MKLMFLAVTGLAVVGTAAGAEKAATISRPAEFLKTVAAVRADAHNDDKFKERVTSPLDGQSFKIVLPFDTNLVAAGGPSYDYKAGKLTLSLETGRAWPLTRSPNDALQVLLLTEKIKSLGSYIGQNAFGATARVDRLENDGAGIALVSTPRPMKQMDDDGILARAKTGWFYEQELPPGEAKALALNSAVEVEGTYTKVPWGDAGFCDFGGADPTIANPTDYTSEKCYLGAKVTRLAFVNEVTGIVLKEWTEAGDPALGPELWSGIRLGMDKYQVRALWPSMTDYGEINANGLTVSVRMEDGRVSSVEMLLLGGAGDTAYAMLRQKYGEPAASICFVNMCSGKWVTSNGVSIYYSAGGDLVYQAAGAPTPVGFSLN